MVEAAIYNDDIRYWWKRCSITTWLLNEIVSKTDEEWKRQLTPSSMRYVEEKEQSFLFQENMLILRKKEYTGVYAVVTNCSDQITNSIQELVGQLHSTSQI